MQVQQSDMGNTFQKLKANILSENIDYLAHEIIKRDQNKFKDFIAETFNVNPINISNINSDISRVSDTEVKIKAEIKLNGWSKIVEYYLDVENKEPFIKK